MTKFFCSHKFVPSSQYSSVCDKCGKEVQKSFTQLPMHQIKEDFLCARSDVLAKQSA